MFSQIMIAFTGVIAIYLTQQRNEKWKRFACLFGMAGQPFWIYSAYQSGLYGILILSIFYAYAWGLGFYNNWIKK